MTGGWRVIEHNPEWVRALLPINSRGATWPGWRCGHELENGAGRCTATTFDPDEPADRCACVVPATPPGGTLPQ
jgi:hypothetical protein